MCKDSDDDMLKLNQIAIRKFGPIYEGRPNDR